MKNVCCVGVDESLELSGVCVEDWNPREGGVIVS